MRPVKKPAGVRHSGHLRAEGRTSAGVAGIWRQPSLGRRLRKGRPVPGGPSGNRYRERTSAVISILLG